MATRYVFLHPPGQLEAVPAGKLELVMRDGNLLTSRFQYGRRYLERIEALDVDPVSLPLRQETDVPREPVNGLALFGAIRDAAPDAWGRRVIENRLRRTGPLPEVDYLDHAGADRAGALDIRTAPDSPPRQATLPATVELPYLLEAVERIEAGDPVPAQLAHFFDGGPTMGGMRPKAVVLDAGRQFVAKFPSTSDRRFNVPAVEQATLVLARMCGLDVPFTRLVPLDGNRSAMLIERFDRAPVEGGFARLHMVSALTMLGVTEMASPDQSYAAIADVISTRGAGAYVERDRVELFKRMVFNILVTNNDDHLRNHAFLYDSDARGWRLSPLYDVVPSPVVGTERFLNLGVGPHGRAARLDNALAGAGRFGIHRRAAARLIEALVEQVRTWRNIFDDCGVSEADSDAVAGAFRRARDIGFAEVARASGAPTGRE
ncbi:MAG: type II toxin-antitoxin system HipA family toxin [Dyella sp.]|uniref:type II toxin-antitoxin system HipA family toxin n=1 Tax=Dyella sp. TaxID=1869338 RepID=UPI003F7EC519